MLQARLEELPADARRALRAASVFGELFRRSGVEALLGDTTSASELDRSVALLVEREVIEKRRAGSVGEDQLAFRHALVRDAAYSMLTDADRVLGHRLAGDWLERNGERDAMTLAEHFEQGGMPDRAIAWFERAAAQAIEGHDLEAAIARAERGITCGAGGSTLGRLRLIQASAHDWRGENVEACDRAAEAFARSAHGSEPWFAAACELAVTYRRLVRRDELRALGEQIAAIGNVELTNGEPLRAVGRIIIQLAISGFREIAEPIARGLARHEALLACDPGARAWVLASRAMLTMVGGDPTVFVRDAELIIGAADESGDRRMSP
ncbi:MAG: hypothetical protein M3619_24915 [Myxococcota bacterium]|nr:hypothetical protein [Myxococcota bacterium]